MPERKVGVDPGRMQHGRPHVGLTRRAANTETTADPALPVSGPCSDEVLPHVWVKEALVAEILLRE